ncbi:LutB/LldF family L-lactate oxidation iron-sulfur protein [Hyphomicrobium sp.]|uniref:LutB/LldF family L-lactate oxidation iron-sulfur protein n=1 Tax=Hyphomicrobium sp. TaxID=82 RepID=UPI0025C5F242|nr:LutB/LldF family L-lactate oxidation iron-sulfur protein [Hyphomicrobium sp.]MCC7250799.1 iron-sulfur cluster-binding protein [Hyphomicrobium sp.]
MAVKTLDFHARASKAITNESLQKSFSNLKSGFVAARARAVAALPEFEAMREAGAAIKDHTLDNLDFYLERFEAEVTKRGGKVHWAADAEEARLIIREICADVGAKTVVKGKSMVSEEIGLNEALEAEGLEVLETDAGEYIVQLAKEAPSHIVMPTVHKTTEDIADLFQEHHRAYGFSERAHDAAELIAQVRTLMRDKYFAADVGITGANFLIAETGSNIIVTNEGNGDLSCTLARVHIVTAGIEKLVPTLNDASVLLRLLARSALGLETTSYTTLSTGPRRPGDLDGPEQYHVVLVDNGRTKMLAGAFRPMLRCIRCGACMNHCPVYLSVGGHAYGSVYPGPMGSVLTPMIAGHEKAKELPHACTLNGRCQQVCPVKIPLPDLLRRLRHDQWEEGFIKGKARWGISLWSWLAARPALYRILTRLGITVLGIAGRSRGSFTRLPLAGGWTTGRDMPAPQGTTFHAAWAKRKKRA